MKKVITISEPQNHTDKKPLSQVRLSRFQVFLRRPPVGIKKPYPTLEGGMHLMFFFFACILKLGINSDRSSFGINLFHGRGQDHQLSKTVLKYIFSISPVLGGYWGRVGTQTKQTDSNADSQAPDFQADGQTDRKTGR